MEESSNGIQLEQPILNGKSMFKTCLYPQQTVRALSRDKAPDRKKAAYTA